MKIRKEIKDNNEFYLWFNGKLIYKKWLNEGYSKVFDKGAWGKYTSYSITDFDLDETPPFFEVTAILNLTSTEDGGRTKPISSGYRPDHVFEFEKSGIYKYAYIGDVQLGSKHQLNPGESAEVKVRFLTHQPIEKQLIIGKEWFLYEGPIKIGFAKISNIKLPSE